MQEQYHIGTEVASRMRYPTAGDWIVREGHPTQIVSADTGNPDYNFLLQLHEWVECYIAMKHGITDEQVTAFDIRFEQEIKEGLHGEDGEPGDDPRNPAYEAHQFATVIERMACTLLGVDWNVYDRALAEIDVGQLVKE